jgi:hypothetical protein
MRKRGALVARFFDLSTKPTRLTSRRTTVVTKTNVGSPKKETIMQNKLLEFKQEIQRYRFL